MPPGWPVDGPTSRADAGPAGRSMRSRVPRSVHAGWSASARRSDPVRVLAGQEVGRVPELCPCVTSAWSRSRVHVLPGCGRGHGGRPGRHPGDRSRGAALRRRPPVQLRWYASPERTLVFDLNDFDETLPGPLEWDLERLVASVEVAAVTAGSPEPAPGGDPERRRAYRLAMRGFADQHPRVWYARLTADDDAVGGAARWGRGVPVTSTARSKAMGKDSPRRGPPGGHHGRSVLLPQRPSLRGPDHELAGEADRVTPAGGERGDGRLPRHLPCERSTAGAVRLRRRRSRSRGWAASGPAPGSCCWPRHRRPVLLQLKEAGPSAWRRTSGCRSAPATTRPSGWSRASGCSRAPRHLPRRTR